MKKSIANDLSDLTIILESLHEKLDKGTISNTELIDVAARLKPIAKHCKVIDEACKEYVKDKRKGVEGTVMGELFKAVLKLVPTKRLDQAGLKENEPDIHAEYNLDVTDERITFELR